MKKLAVLGPKGTYSDKAALKLEETYQIEYFPNILEVIHHMDDETDALVPFENTLDGFVMESLDGIIKTKASIHYQVKLDVNFNFASYEEKIEEIKEVYVQFKAYGQCQDFILKHNLIPIITQSNIESLELLKKKERKNVGAILPSHIPLEEFPCVYRSIIGEIKDETRFVLLSKEAPQIHEGSNLSCSVVITPKLDQPGVLYSILKSFNDHGINLSAILSRPRKDIMGKYIFYIEFMLNQKDLASLEALQLEIEEKEECDFHILGYYNLL
ncbi:MAG: hypothetical protein K2M84_02685 [Anaeroplasmataceae bacterium]|nr:hypothetical protein [Anaeroplasmataceae bacterium]